MEGVPSLAVQLVPQFFPTSDGQIAEDPVQTSAISQSDAAARQTVPADLMLHVVASQQASAEEQALFAFKVQVLQSQQGSEVLPQSHS